MFQLYINSAVTRMRILYDHKFMFVYNYDYFLRSGATDSVGGLKPDYSHRTATDPARLSKLLTSFRVLAAPNVLVPCLHCVSKKFPPLNSL